VYAPEFKPQYPKQNKKGHGVHSCNLSYSRKEYERTSVQGQPNPISTNKQGVTVHVCNPSYWGGTSRMSTVLRLALSKNLRPYLKNKEVKKQGWGHGSSGRVHA
jgi:hypothetical protein